MTLQGHRDFVLAVAYTTDGDWLVTGSKAHPIASSSISLSYSTQFSPASHD